MRLEIIINFNKIFLLKIIFFFNLIINFIIKKKIKNFIYLIFIYKNKI